MRAFIDCEQTFTSVAEPIMTTRGHSQAKPEGRPDARPDAKSRLHEAALRLATLDESDTSVRAIAREAGVSQGALYRHYASREDLLGAVFAEQIEPMIAHKEGLVAMRAPIRDRVREWVRSTYDRFDREPDGFAFVFLTTHNLPEKHKHIAGRQSALLTELLRQWASEGKLKDMPIELASAMFVGLMLSVPERVRKGSLAKPAAQYTDRIADSIWAVLAEEEGESSLG
ncbi:MAG: TetR/AcrR family transcriptional regulator [Phycisphaera sp.]|nr:MAG: TetR/AcrR family transcriptional regulator [Phycisphaera sp.]